MQKCLITEHVHIQGNNNNNNNNNNNEDSNSVSYVLLPFPFIYSRIRLRPRAGLLGAFPVEMGAREGGGGRVGLHFTKRYQ